MPELKITYFDLRGRAEPCRLAMVIGKLPFTDNRFKFPEFDMIKPQTPYRAVPTLHVDDAVYAQSGAILRYLGKLGGLYPSDELAALRVDEVVDTMTDLFAAVYRYMGDDEERKRVEREKMLKDELPRFFGGVEKRLELFGDGPFVVGGEVSVADLAVTSLVNTFKCGVLDYVPKDALDGYPRLMKAYRAVMELPEVVEWYKKYPIDNVTTN